MRRLAVVLVVFGALVSVRPAHAAGQMIVSPSTDLNPAGQAVEVTGSGYDAEKGVYVAWCVVPPAGQKPTPCGGGDNQGGSGSSAWISSNPAYGATLAKPYGAGGTFKVSIRVSRMIGDVDCFVTACAVTTRNDHEHTDDRSQDVFVTVRFSGQGGGSNPPPPPPAAVPTTAPRARAAATTVAPTTTSSVAETTTTTAVPEEATSTSAATEIQTASAQTDDNDGSGAPLVLGGLALLALGGVGTAVAIRRRSA